MKRRILAALGVAAFSVALAFVPTGTANAAVTGHYGHRDTWFDINGNVTYDTSPTRAIRVGVEIRTIDNNSVDLNTCIQPIDSSRILRVSLNEQLLWRDSTNLRDVTTQYIGGNVGSLCVDLDPNAPAVCGPSRASNFFGSVGWSMRRTDNALITKTAGTATATLPCD